MNKDTPQKIVEIKNLIGIKELNHIIEEAIQNIYNSDCFIMISGQLERSKHNTTPHDCYIVLGTNEQRDRLHLLWDLFHEFGHHLDENKLTEADKFNSEKRLIREKTAWQYADEIFLRYPELEKYESNYLEYRSSCLSSYEILDYQGLL